jgi:hypothetical protein
MAEVVGAVEEPVFSAGRGTKFIVIKVKGLQGRDFLFGSDDKVNPAAGFGSEEIVDARPSVVSFKVEKGECFLDTFGTWSRHSSSWREVAERIGEDGHFDVEFGAIGVGAALGGGEIALFSLEANGGGCGASVEKAFDVAGLDDVESHKAGFFDHGGEDAVLISGIGSDDELIGLGKTGQFGTVGEVDLGVHEDDVSLVGEGKAAVVRGGFDGVGGFHEDVNGLVLKEVLEIASVKRSGSEFRDFGGSPGVKVGDQGESEAGSGIDLESDAATHATGPDEADANIFGRRNHEGG